MPTRYSPARSDRNEGRRRLRWSAAAIAVWTVVIAQWPTIRAAGAGAPPTSPNALLVRTDDAAIREQATDDNTDCGNDATNGNAATNSDAAADFPPPISAADALATMRPRDGFRIELVAAEPLVMDPIAFDWGPDGKLWVVEMADYPLGIDGRGQPGGRVRFLEDTDGDGRYDRSTLFIDGLTYPNGVLAWRNGVLISSVPEIIFATDSDGDGVCDERRTLFRGFSRANPQHLMNGFAWGLDNWLYCGGDQHQGEIRSEPSGRTIVLGRRDFRIRPDDGAIEPVTGQTQFVRARNDWGDWFGCTNSEPAFHFALADRYLRRNPYLRPDHVRVQISDVPGASPVFPASRTVARFNDLNKVNRFTSACGLSIYRDELFGPEFMGNTFVSEPVHNLVHREVVTPAGSTFASRRAADEATSEFLASTDHWFRPAMTRTGPDGALWIADMYRLVIEHPEWIPDDWEARLDLRAGDDRGRIYRMLPADVPPRAIPRTADMASSDLVALLGSANGEQRDMAQRMLVWRGGTDAVAALEGIVREHPRAASRLQALCTLDGLDALPDELVLTALRDSHPGVRRHAIRLSEQRLDTNDALATTARALVDDPDPKVEMQLAYSLGESDAEESGRALGLLLARAAPGSHLQTAAMSSVLPHLQQAAHALLSNHESPHTAGAPQGPLADSPPADGGVALAGPAAETVAELLAAAVVRHDEQAVQTLIEGVLTPHRNDRASRPGTLDRRSLAWQLRALTGLPQGLARGRQTLEVFAAESGGSLRESLAAFRRFTETALQTLINADALLDDRLAALALLQQPGLAGGVPLHDLLTPQTPLDLQVAVVVAMNADDSPETARRLLAGWPTYGPQMRAAVMDALFSRPAWQQVLLDEVAAGKVSRADFDAARRQMLLAHDDAQIRQQAAALLGGASDATRAEVLRRYQSAASLAGDAERGAVVFKKHCANCHRLGDEGHAVGPDLAALSDRSPQALLVGVFDPNRAVEARYVGFTAVDTSGRVQSGLLVSEAGGSVELLAAEGKRHVIPRSDLDVLQSTGKSLMPEGLEKDLQPQDVADIAALLSSRSMPRKQFPGNEPRRVRAESLRGEFWLVPRDCEVYGDTLTLQADFADLREWRSESDHAVWTLDVERAGDYRLSLEYACDGSNAGERVIVRVGDRLVSHRVISTGGWGVYRSVHLDRVALPVGRVHVSLRASGAPAAELFRLQSVRLSP